MRKVEVGGMTCWSDSARYLPGGYWSSELAMLSLFGSRTAVRAAWARLSGGKRHDNGIKVGEDSVRLQEGTKYVTISTPMADKQTLHMLLLHPSCTHQYSPFAQSFVQVGHAPEEDYFSRLNRMCPIPFRSAWAPYMWRQGREQNLVKPLEGFGMPGYMVDASDAWAPVIKMGIETGALV